MAPSIIRRKSTESATSLSDKNQATNMPPNAPVGSSATADAALTKKSSKMKRLFDSASRRKKNASVNKPASATGASAKHPNGGEIIKMDKYGFLLEEDEQCLSSDGHSSTLDTRRWENILDKVPTKNQSAANISLSTSQSKVKYYARRGLPDLLRQKAWTVLTGVDLKMNENPGEYNTLVERAEKEYRKMKDLESAGDTSSISRLGNLLDTIERDIHRTFPKHYLFSSGFGEDENGNNGVNGKLDGEQSDPENLGSDDEDENEDASSLDIDDTADIGESVEAKRQEFNESIQKSLRGREDDELLENFGVRGDSTQTAKNSVSQHSEALEMGHGQDSLRNVLRAYSMYDSEVGYCQGMNFIAAMFLTFLSEEESFWLLVVVMNQEPYKLRDLFGEDMSGTHEVLYIAEKLLGKFLPDLSKHMEAQGVHVSMFAVTWLVTLYVREFPFDLVARVWDCFLVEGWKVVYRVMLSLLEHASKDILGLQFEEILHYLRALPSKVNGQAIMAGSLKIALKRKHIQKYAIEWRQNAGGG